MRPFRFLLSPELKDMTPDGPYLPRAELSLERRHLSFSIRDDPDSSGIVGIPIRAGEIRSSGTFALCSLRPTVSAVTLCAKLPVDIS